MAFQSAQTGMGHRGKRPVAQLRPPLHGELHQIGQGHQALDRQDIRHIHVQLIGQPALQGQRHVGADLQAGGAGKFPIGQLRRHHADDTARLEFRLVLIKADPVPGVVLCRPGHAEGVGGEIVDVRKKLCDIGRDHLFQRHDSAPARHGNPAGPVGGDLDPDETGPAPFPVGSGHRQIESQVADKGEGMAGINRQRRENRLDAVLIIGVDRLLLAGTQVLVVADRDAFPPEGRPQLILHQMADPGGLPLQLLPAGDYFLARGASVRRQGVGIFLQFVAQAPRRFMANSS